MGMFAEWTALIRTQLFLFQAFNNTLTHIPRALGSLTLLTGRLSGSDRQEGGFYRLIHSEGHGVGGLMLETKAKQIVPLGKLMPSVGVRLMPSARELCWLFLRLASKDRSVYEGSLTSRCDSPPTALDETIAGTKCKNEPLCAEDCFFPSNSPMS